MNVSRPFSTNGRNASCCALLNRCTSSTNRIVGRPDCAQDHLGARNGFADVLDAGEHRGDRDELGIERFRHQARQRRLAHAGRPPQDHRMQLAGVERHGKRLAGAEQMPLTDDFVERAGAQALGQRGRRRAGWRTDRSAFCRHRWSTGLAPCRQRPGITLSSHSRARTIGSRGGTAMRDDSKPDWLAPRDGAPAERMDRPRHVLARIQSARASRSAGPARRRCSSASSSWRSSRRTSTSST